MFYISQSCTIKRKQHRLKDTEMATKQRAIGIDPKDPDVQEFGEFICQTLTSARMEVRRLQIKEKEQQQRFLRYFICRQVAYFFRYEKKERQYTIAAKVIRASYLLQKRTSSKEMRREGKAEELLFALAFPFLHPKEQAKIVGKMIEIEGSLTKKAGRPTSLESAVKSVLEARLAV